MTSRAHAEFDPSFLGVRVAVQRGTEGPVREVLTWQHPGTKVVDLNGRQIDPQEAEDGWLHLQEEDARAIYEALADYFGHSGNDVRALRRDYEAERARVDKFIDGSLTTPTIIVNGSNPAQAIRR
jgi:hypothetical protein